MKFYVETLGCWLNKADSELIAQRLEAAGGTRGGGDPSQADLVVLNTCAVRQEAEESAVRFLRRVGGGGGDGRGGRRIVASGCLVRVRPDRLRKAAPGVELVDLRSVEEFERAIAGNPPAGGERPMKALPEFLGGARGGTCTWFQYRSGAWATAPSAPRSWLGGEAGGAG